MDLVDYSHLWVAPTLLDEIEKALKNDNKDDFVNLIKGLTRKDEDDDVLDNAHELLFENDAANCAAAVLDGQTDGIFHLGPNLFMTAATYLAPRISQLVLHRFVPPHAYLDDTRPLTHVLSYIGRKTKSKSCVSAYTLALALCKPGVYGGLMHVLETVRFFAQKTKGINPLFLNYLKEGCMAEVAALLFVASERLLPSSSPSPDGFFGFKTFAQMNLFLSANKSFTSDRHDSKLIEEELPILLQMFAKLGDKIAACVWLDGKQHYHIELALTPLLQDAGFYPGTRYTGPCTFRVHSHGSHRWGSLDSETKLGYGCHKSISDTAHLMPGWSTRNKVFLPLESKPYSFAALSRRLYHSKPSGNTNLISLAPVKRLAGWRQHRGTQIQFALLAAALRKGLRHV